MSKLVKNSIYYTLVGFLPMFISVFTLPLWAKYITPEEMGERSLIVSFMNLLTIIGSIQLYSSVTRLFFDYETKEEKSHFYSSLLNSLFIIALILAVLFYFFHGSILSAMKFDFAFYPNLAYGVISGIIAIPTGLTTAFFKVKEKAKHLMVISISLVGFDIVFKLILVVGMDQGLEGYMLSMCLTYILTLITHFIYFFKDYKLFVLDKNIFKKSALFGLPVIPHALGGYLFMYSDKIILTRFIESGAITKAMIGVYGIAEVFASLYKVLINSFAKSISPQFMKLCKKSTRLGAKFMESVSKEWFLFIGISFMLMVFFQEYAITLFVWFTGYDEYLGAISMIPYLTLAFLFRGIYILPINTFYFTKKTKFLPIITLFSGTLNVVLNFISIPYLGVMGAVYATTISFFINWILIEYFTRFTFKINYGKGTLIVLILIASITLLTNELLSGYNWAISIPAKIIVTFTIIFGMYFLNIVQFKTTLNKYIWLVKKRIS